MQLVDIVGATVLYFNKARPSTTVSQPLNADFSPDFTLDHSRMISSQPDGKGCITSVRRWTFGHHFFTCSSSLEADTSHWVGRNIWSLLLCGYIFLFHLSEFGNFDIHRLKIQKHFNEFSRLLEAIQIMSFLHRTDFGNFDVHQLMKIHKCENN